MTDLKVGDKIKIQGWVMMKSLEDGDVFKVIKIREFNKVLVYDLQKTRGKKIISHYASDIDLYLNTGNSNQIIKL